MKIIGITGNSGSGKSTAARILREMGGYIIDADALSREVMEVGEGAYDETVCVFGDGILRGDRTIDRKALGSIVFNDSQKLGILIGITHKYILNRMRELIGQAERSGDYAFIVLDAPLLIEAKLHEICDDVWLVVAADAERLRRVMSRDGLNETEAAARFASQTPSDELVKHATFVLENDGELDRLKSKILERLECFMP